MNARQSLLDIIHDRSAALNAQGKAVNGSRILILGIAYKKNIGDMRESPAARVMELLQKRGAILTYSNPHVPDFPPMRQHSFNLACMELNAETLSDQDCVMVITDHETFDYDLVFKHARAIVDSRGVFRNKHSKVLRA